MAVYPAPVAEAVIKLVLRLPPDLHAALVQRAREEQRSLNGQIIYLLRQSLRRQH
jgi:hypothetical protein